MCPEVLSLIPTVGFDTTRLWTLWSISKPYLHFVDGLALLQILAPHRDSPLVVGHTPALLTQTLRLEAGKRPVIRDGHSLPRHGSLRTGGGGSGGSQGLLYGPEERRPAGETKGRDSASRAVLRCVYNLSNSICCLPEALVGSAAASCAGQCASRRATRAAVLPQTTATVLRAWQATAQTCPG